jgi:hypothetical protein
VRPLARSAAHAILLLILGVTACDAQSHGAGCWPTIRRCLLPDALAHVYELRDSIRAYTEFSLDPESAFRLHTDLQRLDSIYIQAVELCEGDIREALLVCAVATLPYHTFPAVIPLTGIVIWVPVSTESRDDFARRLEALPSQLYLDSPRYGDRDKLPHFFGSAWLYCLIRSSSIVSLIGHGIEIFEGLFKLEGSYDERDVEVNRLGMDFAKRLMENDETLPSEVFLGYR